MFSRHKEEPTPEGPYHVQAVHSARSHDTLAKHVEDQMNAGHQQGWRLITVTQHAAVVLLYWDAS